MHLHVNLKEVCEIRITEQTKEHNLNKPEYIVHHFILKFIQQLNLCWHKNNQKEKQFFFNVCVS